MNLAIALLCTILVAADAQAAEYRTGRPVMGTILQVTVIAADPIAARNAAEVAIAEVERWDDILTTWRAEGELAILNRAAGTGPVRVGRALHGSLETMVRLSADTGGAFDPAVAPLVTAWRRGGTQAAVDAGVPTSIGAALSLHDGGAALARGAALDAGGIGKGIALDAAAVALRANGIDAAFIDFGGSSQLAIGAPPDSPRGWPVAVAGFEVGTVRGVVLLRDASLSTSRSRAANAREGAIVDPRSRRPVVEARLATVLAHSAATADAWSTALIVAGREGVVRAAAFDCEVYYEDGGGDVQTPGFI
jgi:thiamine biosynthesis lipoprotein